jgi:UDP-2,3-diacylglucosamine pyrophosphatase LpxH
MGGGFGTMDIYGSDLHIESPWSNKDAQHRFLDLVEQEKPDRVVLIGDTFEALVDVKVTLASEITIRLKDIASRTEVFCLPGNFPHDEWKFLYNLTNDIRPIKAVKAVTSLQPGNLLTHGAEFDPTIRFWEHFRWAYRLLPGLVHAFIKPSPSSLANKGKYDELVRLAGVIHQSAQRHAIDNNYRVVFCGHTHLRQRLDAEPSHRGVVEVLGSLGQGPYLCALCEHDKYVIRQVC